MTDLGGKTCIFSHPVYLFLREFSLQDSRGGSIRPFRKATYTHFPEIDPRLRNYRSRYGAISND
ncbi:DUF2856 family protein [Escherichia coli]|nr:DUF2856 family protein [Escherichia coli]